MQAGVGAADDGSEGDEMNLINHIGNKVTVWTKEGNSLTNRTLVTADELGIVVSGDRDDREVFIPWCRVKYVDLIKRLKAPSSEFVDRVMTLAKHEGDTH